MLRRWGCHLHSSAAPEHSAKRTSKPAEHVPQEMKLVPKRAPRRHLLAPLDELRRESTHPSARPCGFAGARELRGSWMPS